MDSKELMIGNYVKDPYNNTIKLVSIERDASMTTAIPLTWRWLMDFGFADWDGVACKNNIEVYGYFEDGYYRVNLTSYYFTLKYKYVHQLQNLYFALTGEQLTLITK